MSRWRFALVGLLAALAFLPATERVAAGDTFPSQNIASESYYALNVEEGTMSVRVEALVQPGGADIDEVWLWLMPGGTDVKVMQDGVEIEHEFTDLGLTAADPKLLIAKLAKTLRGKLTTELVMTYAVPTQDDEFTRMQPGAIEAAFVSQGAGSFVLVDVPQHGQNVMDPGCLKAASQPDGVKEIGYERWVCGEALLIALSTDDPETLQKCARLDDRCRQRLIDTPFSAFVQSVTDASLQGVLKEPISLGEREFTLELQYFREDAAWAQRQFEVATQALPKLEALFGQPYPFDTIILRQSHHIEWIGAAGVAFNGQMLLASDTGVDDEVTIHEIAHQWAGLGLEGPWLWEGLAEYATQVIAPELGIATRDWGWQATGFTDPLATWYNGSGVFDSYYWYGKSAAFWHAYEAAVGGRENMTTVLGQMEISASADPITGRWFMDRGEEVSGANLDALFLEWVWVPDYAGRELEARRTAYDLVNALKLRAVEFGFEGIPTDIQSSMDSWSFKSISDKVTRANAALDGYAVLLTDSDAAGLARSNAVAAAWPESTITQVEGVIQQQRRVIESIVNAAETIAEEPAGSAAWDILDEARDAYAEGDLAAASELASEAVAYVYNQFASVQMIEIAEIEKGLYKENFFKRIGMLFEDPDADLQAAYVAVEAGETAEAVRLARQAFETWNGAQARGLQRLAMLAGVMSALTFGSWFLLRRIDFGRDDEVVSASRARRAVEGNQPPPEKRSWRDWENTN
jgi:hypothetical protein